MKQALQILFLFGALPLFSQSDISKISSDETVTFVAATSGCFNASTNTYKFVRQKNDDRKISYTMDGVKGSKKISAKKYSEFVKKCEESANRFSNPDETPTCTNSIKYTLNSKKGSSKFANTSCEFQFDPEELLRRLLK